MPSLTSVAAEADPAMSAVTDAARHSAPTTVGRQRNLLSILPPSKLVGLDPVGPRLDPILGVGAQNVKWSLGGLTRVFSSLRHATGNTRVDS